LHNKLCDEKRVEEQQCNIHQNNQTKESYFRIKNQSFQSTVQEKDKIRTIHLTFSGGETANSKRG